MAADFTETTLRGQMRARETAMFHVKQRATGGPIHHAARHSCPGGCCDGFDHGVLHPADGSAAAGPGDHGSDRVPAGGDRSGARADTGGEGRPDLYLRPDVVVSAADIASAEQSFDPLGGQPIVSIVLNEAGRDRLAAFTRTHIGKILAITVDGTLLTAPVIREPIMGGALQISGIESTARAQELAGKLGRPPVPATRSLAEALEASLP